MSLRYEELRKESARNEDCRRWAGETCCQERAMEAMEGREEVLEEEVALSFGHEMHAKCIKKCIEMY